MLRNHTATEKLAAHELAVFSGLAANVADSSAEKAGFSSGLPLVPSQHRYPSDIDSLISSPCSLVDKDK